MSSPDTKQNSLSDMLHEFIWRFEELGKEPCTDELELLRLMDVRVRRWKVLNEGASAFFPLFAIGHNHKDP